MTDTRPSQPVGGEPTDRSLLERFRRGSGDAATLLYRRYAERLRDLARAQCGPDLARLVEPDDIVQSVFGSFFRGASQGVYALPDGEELWKLFLVIALNKIRARARYHRAARRDLGRTVQGAEGGPGLEEVVSGGDAAEVLLQLAMDEALGRLPPPQREAIRLRVEGYEVAEIAALIRRSHRSTERLLQEARDRLAALLKPDEDDP